jgi:hypothetical protein
MALMEGGPFAAVRHESVSNLVEERINWRRPRSSWLKLRCTEVLSLLQGTEGSEMGNTRDNPPNDSELFKVSTPRTDV